MYYFVFLVYHKPINFFYFSTKLPYFLPLYCIILRSSPVILNGFCHASYRIYAVTTKCQRTHFITLILFIPSRISSYISIRYERFVLYAYAPLLMSFSTQDKYQSSMRCKIFSLFGKFTRQDNL